MRERPRQPAQRPVLLFYCQHSLGIGHLTRSFALAEALAQCFRVVFLNGGRLPPGLPVPAEVDIIDLPPLGMDDGHTVVSRDAVHEVTAAWALRRRLIQQAVQRHSPRVLLVELFPFGRKKFAGEILPLIRAARRQPEGPALVACSLRDILVSVRPDQQHHDDRARWLTERYFDVVLVHADRALAELEESFKPRRALATPLVYTGYVVPAREARRNHPREIPRAEHLLVSAGGGIVGAPLFELALAARAHLREPQPLRIVAGPFLPPAQWQALSRRCEGVPGVTLVRQVPDMVAEMRHARASLSQCGYNTALDIACAGVPALVLPYATATENEQAVRAERLAARGVLRAAAAGLDAPALARELEGLRAFAPRPAGLDLGGAQRSAEHLHRLCTQREETPA